MNQLAPDLKDESQQQPLGTWRYDYSSKSLVEEVGETKYIYGSWGHLFGCWKTTPDGNETREIIPFWQFMDLNGVWLDSDIDFRRRFPDFNQPRSLKGCRHERAAFVAYLSTIPRSIRSLVAPFNRYSWFLLDLIWQVPKFARFLDREIQINSGQFIIATLALANAYSFSRKNRREIAELMMTKKRSELLFALEKNIKPSLFLKIVNRLRNTYHYNPEFYRHLAKATNCPKRARILTHEQNPRHDFVVALSYLPDELLQTHTIRYFCDNWENECVVQDVMDLLDMVSPEIRARVADSLNSAKSIEDTERLMHRWSNDLVNIVDFPAPPLPAHKDLRPLLSLKAMKNEAFDMRNCLADMIHEVVSGLYYYYHWYGPEPVTLCLHCNDSTTNKTWTFHHAAGYKNKELPVEQIKYLRGLVNNLASPEIHPR